jgi:hypothetical protein
MENEVKTDAPAPQQNSTKKSAEDRKALLAQAIQTQVVGGGRIESQSDFQAVIIKGHKVNHVLHFIIGFFTFFLWWIVWAVIAITGGEKRSMVTVDEFGNVMVQKISKS